MKEKIKNNWREMLSWVTVFVWIIWTFNNFDFNHLDLLYVSDSFWPLTFILLSYPILILYLLSRRHRK